METESVHIEQTVQPEAPVTSETPQASAPIQPARRKGPIGKILIGLLILSLLVGTGVLGYKGYTLNNELTAAQASLDKLQGQHDQLQADNEKLAAEIAQTRADIEKATEDTTTAKDDLQDVNDKAKAVDANLKSVEAYVTVMESLFVKQDSNLLILVWILTSEDKELFRLYEGYLESESDEDARIFMSYLITTVVTDLKK